MIINAGRTLAKYKDDVKKKIDTQAELTRATFITPGAGQAMAYQEKLRQALAYKIDPTAEAFEHIHLEAAVYNITPEAMADMIIAKAEKWREISAVIESVRLSTKAKVDAAVTFASVDAEATINWDDVLTPTVPAAA